MCTLLRRPDVRLLTLTGTGGIGKTRLGLQVATELLGDFADGVYFVSLASIRDPELVIPAIAQTFGLREADDWPLLERLHAYLTQKHLLLLLDNFEQIVEAAPKLVELLAVCPHLKTLVTSRAVLHLHGEHEFPLMPLALPAPGTLANSETLSHYAAIALFLQRAQASRPDFEITATNAHTIAEICIRLDGLPLAIELAAARIKLLPPQTLLTRLERRLEILTSISRDAPARQQTLRNTLAWSYDLLDAQEQQLFRQLSVFVGGCTLEAVEAVCTVPGGMTFSVLDGMMSLIDKSLLYRVKQAEEEHEPRFTMLETVREYAQECLINSGEVLATQRAHALYYLGLVEEAEARLTGSEQKQWLERLEYEHENLRATLLWLLEQEGDIEMALRLSGALWRFWWIRGQVREGQGFLERALTASVEVPTKCATR